MIVVSGVAVNAGAADAASSCMPPNPPDEVQANDAGQATPDDALTQRLAEAELVISGVASAPVRFAQPVAAGKAPFSLSQHDPDWWQSTIEIESVEKGMEKGKAATKTMVVWFANSVDIAWHQSPKIKKGDHAIWLLQNRDTFGRPVPGPAVVHPLDCQPITELERVRTLLKSPKK
jgi:hypothetical protein